MLDVKSMKKKYKSLPSLWERGSGEGLLGVIFLGDKTSLISGSSEIWSDKPKVLYNRHTE